MKYSNNPTLHNFKRAIGSLLIIGLLAPYTTFAQSSMQSTNYKLDDVNFSSNNALTSSQDGIPPSISSRGPAIIKLTPTEFTVQWETDKKSSSQVEYGTTTSYGQVTGTTSLETLHTVTVTGLTPETLYHYRVVSEDSFGGVGRSGDFTITTPAVTSIQEFSVRNIGYEEAFVFIKTGGLSSVGIDYGTEPTYGLSQDVSTVTSTNQYTFHLTNLKPGTKYFLRIRGTDTKGNAVTVSGVTFNTLAYPSFVSLSARSTSPNEITVDIVTNTRSTINLTYKSAKDPKENTAGDSTLSTVHSILLAKLFGQTEYRLTVTAIDEQGKRVTSAPIIVSTLKDDKAPVSTDPQITITKSKEIILTAKWESNEPVSSKLVIKSKINQADVKEVIGPTNLTTNPVIVATNLAPKTPYLVRAVSTDSAGNESSREINVVTPGLTKSILELILQNLGRVMEPILRFLKLKD